MLFHSPSLTKPNYSHPDPGPPGKIFTFSPWSQNIVMKFSPIRMTREVSILSPDIPNTEWTGLMLGSFMFACIICHNFFFILFFLNSHLLLQVKWDKSNTCAQWTSIKFRASALICCLSRAKINAHLLTRFILNRKTKSFPMFMKNYKLNGFEKPLSMKSDNKFTQWKKWISQLMFMFAFMHQKQHCILGTVRGMHDAFSIHSMYLLTSQSENKKLSRSVWMYIYHFAIFKFSPEP